MSQRYGPRYDNDHRSRSPPARDRSLDRFERASQYSDGDRRRSSAEPRSNNAAFQSNRETFRDNLPRDPPRGPKALLDASGPRGGGFGGDFGRGRGRGRGRGWSHRDDSRDRGRDRDDTFRDRREQREERSRERERDRDRDRDRDRERDWRESRDGFRRRQSPGRDRTPPRDFRERASPLVVDAERARRDSRDGGPPSAGSSSSDPPFAATFLRGGFGRGRGRGRGDWDARGRGGRGGLYDDRDRYGPRSRSQDGRWSGRDRDDRDRGDRYMDVDVRRDPSDDRERDRDSIRPKMERGSLSHEPSPITSRDVSPPPLAPSAPAFGSVPTRTQTMPESQSVTGGTGKPPPAAPRAERERPRSAGNAGPGDSQPLQTGLSKPPLREGSPLIPTGPRAQQQKQQRPSSKQWINPALQAKKISESPKIMRSQSFVQQQRPFQLRQDPSQPGHADDSDRRPRSSDAKSESQLAVADGQLRDLHLTEPGEVVIKLEGQTQSDRSSIDRDLRPDKLPGDISMGGMDPEPAVADVESKTTDKAACVSSSKEVSPSVDEASTDVPQLGTDADQPEVPTLQLSGPLLRSEMEQKGRASAASEASDEDHSESDEDMGDFIAMQIQDTEEKLRQLDDAVKGSPLKVITRFAKVCHDAMVQILHEPIGLVDMLGPIPEGVKMPVAKPKIKSPTLQRAEKPAQSRSQGGPFTFEAKAREAGESGKGAPLGEPHAKIEAMDVDGPPASLQATSGLHLKANNTDIAMEDVDAPGEDEENDRISGLQLNGLPRLLYTLGEPLETIEEGKQLPSTPSQMEEDDDGDSTESEDIDPMAIESVRRYMTPPVDSLPDYSCKRWDQDKEFTKSLEADPPIDEFILGQLQRMSVDKTANQNEARKTYASKYVEYLDFTLSDDPIALKSREKFSATAPAPDAVTISSTVSESKPEGRGAGRRFASERDLERVLQASMREDEERKEREQRLQKEKYRSEKEATVPDMYWAADERDNDLYYDNTGFVPLDKIVSLWQVLPPVNNFTEEERDLFEKRYLENPKQWGKVSEVIPKRDFKTCIQYYYLMKKELNLKEKLKKQPKKRKRGRGKQRSSALVSELGNGENENEENQETGENGERRRPRRAAAPTWGFEQPATDSENPTPAGTPGRRGAVAAKPEAGPEKVDGRKGRKRAVRDKDPKLAKPNPMLAATPASGGRGGRSRSNSRAQNPNQDLQPPPQPISMDASRQYEGPAPGLAIPPQAQPPEGLLHPGQSALPPQSSIPEVLAPPSLRPEPPPPPPANVMTFDPPHPQPERRNLPSSYWSVSEGNDFPALLRSFGTDWQAIAAHMGSKTATMVKNYWVRNKQSDKPEWDEIAREADEKKRRGEKRPDPPPPPTGSRRKLDMQPSMPRPLAAASAAGAAGADGSNDPAQPVESAAPMKSFSGRFAIAQASTVSQQPVAQPTQPPPLQIQQHPAAQAAAQSMSPSTRPLRAPVQPFGYTERERDGPQPQAVRISQKPPRTPPVTEPVHQRPLAAAHPIQPPQPEAIMGPEPPIKRSDMELPASLEHSRPPERQQVRLKQEPDVAPAQRPYESFPHHAPTGGRPGPLRSESTPLAKPHPEPPRTAAPAPPHVYGQPLQQPPVRNPLSEPPPVAPQAQRPIAAIQQPRHMQEAYKDPYAAVPPPPAAAPTPPRPTQERKTSSLMALLNDEPVPAAAPPKRVSDISRAVMKTSSTPPPQAQHPPPPPPAPTPLRREEPQPYSYRHTQPPTASGIPALKPYTASPQPQHMNATRGTLVSPQESASGPERDYFRGAVPHAYPPQQAPTSSSPPARHHYAPPPPQPAQVGYQPQPYPYGGPTSQPHAASPPPQYAVHPSSRPPPRDVAPPPNRETAWSHGPQGHNIPPGQQPTSMAVQQQPTGWPAAPPKVRESAPPPQSGWPDPRAQKPPAATSMSQQQSSWAQAPAPQHHMDMREERGPPVYAQSGVAGPPLSQHQHQHSMSGPYPAPVSRAPDLVPPPAQQGYPHYGSTPGPVAGPSPRDPGPRSYTPVRAYERVPPPQHPYPAPPPLDPREVQMRDPREMVRDPRERDPRNPGDPRDAMLQRPYDRPTDPYGR